MNLLLAGGGSPSSHTPLPQAQFLEPSSPITQLLSRKYLNPVSPVETRRSLPGTPHSGLGFQMLKQGTLFQLGEMSWGPPLGPVSRRAKPGLVGAGRRAAGLACAERRPLSSLYCPWVFGGDRSVRVTGGLPSGWELLPQLLWQLRPNPTLFTSCEGIEKGWGAPRTNVLFLPPHRVGRGVRELCEGERRMEVISVFLPACRLTSEPAGRGC